MRAVGLALLAVVTIGVVVFVFVELHAAKAPMPSTSPSLSPAVSPSTEPAVVERRAPTAPTPTPPTNAEPADPMDRVVQGKTRREWRAYYAEQQRRVIEDIERYQEIIDRSSTGEEQDWPKVKDAHTRVRELRDRMKQDLEDLARIENAP